MNLEKPLKIAFRATFSIQPKYLSRLYHKELVQHMEIDFFICAKCVLFAIFPADDTIQRTQTCVIACNYLYA